MAPRRTDVVKIIIACEQLGIDRYDFLVCNFGKKIKSTNDLSQGQAFKALQILKTKGFKVTPAKKAKTPKNRSKLASDPQSRKIRALWITLGKTGVLRDSSEKALRSYVKRMFRVDDLHWANGYQKSIIIESLKDWLKREENKDAI